MYFVLALGMGLLASCGAEDSIDTTTSGDKVAVQFDGSIGTSTRVVDAVWSANDKIGVYMVAANQTLADGSIVEGASNVSYVTSEGDGKFSSVDATKIIYLPIHTSVDFYAYYPYKEVVSDYKLPIDVSDQSNQEAIDLMYATTKGVDKNQPNVQLKFSHALTKVVFDVQPGAGLTADDLEDMTITIEGANNTAQFNLIDGTYFDDGMPKGVTMYKKPNSLTYEAILIPESSDSRTIRFDLNNDARDYFEWTMQGALKEGKKYHYTKVTVTRTEAKVSGTITDWTPVTDDTEYEAK